MKSRCLFMILAFVFLVLYGSVGAEYSLNDGMLFYTYGGESVYRSTLTGANRESLYTVGYRTINELEVDLVEEKLYWVESAGGKLKRSNFDGSNVEDVTDSVGLGYVVAQDKIYYTTADKIMSVNKDGSDKDVILSGIQYPVSLDLDPINNMLYWGARNSNNQWLSRSNIDGSNIELLNNDIYYHTGGLALDVANEKIYWASYENNNSWIRYSNLDGSAVQDVISTSVNPNVQNAKHLEIDFVTGRLYWTDQFFGGKVQSCNLDGTDYMIHVNGGAPYGIAVAHIPEPATFALFTLSAFTLLKRRKRT